jgi:hypothetical protein
VSLISAATESVRDVVALSASEPDGRSPNVSDHSRPNGATAGPEVPVRISFSDGFTLEIANAATETGGGTLLIASIKIELETLRQAPLEYFRRVT